MHISIFLFAHTRTHAYTHTRTYIYIYTLHVLYIRVSINFSSNKRIGSLMTVFWWWPMTDSGESPKYCKLLVSPRSGSLEPASLANSTMSLEMNHPQLAELFMLVNCDIIYPYRWKPTLYVTIGVIAAHLSQTRQEQVSDWKQSPPTSPGKFPISIWANIFGNAHVCLCMNYIYIYVCVWVTVGVSMFGIYLNTESHHCVGQKTMSFPPEATSFWRLHIWTFGIPKKFDGQTVTSHFFHGDT